MIKAFFCSCYDPKHNVIVNRYEDGVEIYVSLNHYMGFWKRIKAAISFIFNPKPFVTYDVVMLEGKELQNFKKSL